MEILQVIPAGRFCAERQHGGCDPAQIGAAVLTDCTSGARESGATDPGGRSDCLHLHYTNFFGGNIFVRRGKVGIV